MGVHPQPKPQARLIDAIERKADYDRQMTALRNAVWKRDRAICRGCLRPVRRTLALVPERGEVHHRHGRRVRPEMRYHPDGCVLLCVGCHRDPQVIARFRT